MSETTPQPPRAPHPGGPAPYPRPPLLAAPAPEPAAPQLMGPGFPQPVAPPATPVQLPAP
ncbi:3-oxoadipate enol-lactonase, partial [Streptomyces sp. ISL-63]|nr:3-oxoadipate enol-lactonase [Streptomyces sp. ISL-63]